MVFYINNIFKVFELKKALNSVNPNLSKIFLPFVLQNPEYFLKSYPIVKNYWCSNEIRRELLDKEGIKVPPIMILSVTPSCNLSCQGCFAFNIGNVNQDISSAKHSLRKEDWINFIDESNKLGVFSYLIAGGEPFMIPNLLDICKSYKNNLFLIFTNGTLINDSIFSELEKLVNTLLIVSLEGNDYLTDKRRGADTFNKAFSTINKLNEKNILSGVSVTITKDNYLYWMEEDNLQKLIDKDIKIAFFIEYIETEASPEKLYSLNLEQRKIFREKILYYKKNKNIFIIHSPGDEDAFGGCVSSGIGFAHINPYGDVTPCPVTNVSSHNIKTSSFKEALKSDFFVVIRENKKLLENNDSACSLALKVKELEQLKNRKFDS